MNVVQGSFKVMGSLNTELRAPHLKLSSEIPPSQELWLPRLPAGSSRQKDSGLKLCPTLRIKTVYLQLVSSSKFHSLLEAVCICSFSRWFFPESRAGLSWSLLLNGSRNLPEILMGNFFKTQN